MQRIHARVSVKIWRRDDFVTGFSPVSIFPTVYTRPMRWAIVAVLAASMAAIPASSATAQPGPELAGSLRAAARTELVNPGLFDPRLDLALTPTPQIVLDTRGADTAVKGRIG